MIPSKIMVPHEIGQNRMIRFIIADAQGFISCRPPIFSGNRNISTSPFLYLSPFAFPDDYGRFNEWNKLKPGTVLMLT